MWKFLAIEVFSSIYFIENKRYTLNILDSASRGVIILVVAWENIKVLFSKH